MSSTTVKAGGPFRHALAVCAVAASLFGPAQAEPPAAQDGGRCYNMNANGDPKEPERLDQFCRAVRTLNSTGERGVTYEQLKSQGCANLVSGRYFVAKPAEAWDLHDFADLVRIKMECRKAAGHANLAFDAPDGIPSELISEVYYIVGAQVAKAKERQQSVIAGEAAARERTKSAEDHVAELKASGFKPVTVSDIQLSGRDMIGQKVVVRGYIDLLGEGDALIKTHRDDLRGVPLSIEHGPLETRRFILENCSRLSRTCRMEIKAIVAADVDGDPQLTLADDIPPSGK